ncbi:MAG: asparaginase [Candidatus Aminicenantes bacterium]|nr:MAG: asparaginase [Candidatus Aminicenantes bacterium]
MKIKIYSTKKSTFVVGEPQIRDILQEADAAVDVEVESPFKKDSMEITEDDCLVICEKVRSDPYRHIIITHGTDTMIQTAKILYSIPDKVIVLTGAMQPAAFKKTDAAFNIGSAILAVQILAPGIYVVMNGKVFDPNKLTKNLESDRFEEL